MAFALVLATLAFSAGAGLLYQYINGNKLQLGEEPEEEVAAAEGGSRRLSIPPLGSGVEDNKRPERTKPFNYVYSDTGATLSRAGTSSESISYSSTPQSEDEFESGLKNFLLQGVDHFRSANAEKDAELIESALAEAT